MMSRPGNAIKVNYERVSSVKNTSTDTGAKPENPKPFLKRTYLKSPTEAENANPADEINSAQKVENQIKEAKYGQDELVAMARYSN